jgi:hypothetical protein
MVIQVILCSSENCLSLLFDKLFFIYYLYRISITTLYEIIKRHYN